MPPSLDIPLSQATVQLSIIDTTTRITNVKTSTILEPPVGSFDTISLPAYSFLVKNPSNNQTVLFDLGVRKDWENLPKPILDRISQAGWVISVEHDVATILASHGVEPESINAIVWSHCHFDHTGDPATFPSSVDLVVGPDGKRRAASGPPLDRSTTSGAVRRVRELDLAAEATLRLGGYSALDFWGDGSFYLLFAPGHTADHLCGLARTTGGDSPSFVFMAADAVHHAGEHRPSAFMELPQEVVPSPLGAGEGAPCPGELFRVLHPAAKADEPFQRAKGGEDKELGRETVSKLIGFDAHENVFCVGAHDASLLDVVDFFPASANEWKAKGWRERTFWRFLGDYVTEAR